MAENTVDLAGLIATAKGQAEKALRERQADVETAEQGLDFAREKRREAIETAQGVLTQAEIAEALGISTRSLGAMFAKRHTLTATEGKIAAEQEKARTESLKKVGAAIDPDDEARVLAEDPFEAFSEGEVAE